MTKVEFKAILKKGHGFADTLNYISCCAIFLFGIYIVSFVDIWIFIVLGILVIVMSIYFFHRISVDYQVNEFISEEPANDKWNLIESYLKKNNIISQSREGNLLTCIYKNKFFAKVKLTFYVDEKRVLFNATAVDMNSQAKGIIDFGISRRASKKIRNLLQQQHI